MLLYAVNSRSVKLKIDFISHYNNFVVVVFCMPWSEIMRYAEMDLV